MTELKTDPLFVGLTRPAMFFGVSYNYFMLNVFASSTYYVNTSSFKVLVFAVAVHLAGVLLCSKEPLSIDMLMMKLKYFNRCRNKTIHGANSYDEY